MYQNIQYYRCITRIALKWRWNGELKIPRMTVLRSSNAENILLKGIHHRITAVHGNKVMKEFDSESKELKNVSPTLLQMIEARLPPLLQNLEFLVPTRNDKSIIYRIYCFARNDQLKECVRRWLCELAAEVYHKGI